MTTVPMGDFNVCNEISLPVTTSANVKSGASVPNGNMDDGVNPINFSPCNVKVVIITVFWLNQRGLIL